jgi:hypothetical protein
MKKIIPKNNQLNNNKLVNNKSINIKNQIPQLKAQKKIKKKVDSFICFPQKSPEIKKIILHLKKIQNKHLNLIVIKISKN